MAAMAARVALVVVWEAAGAEWVVVWVVAESAEAECFKERLQC
jgi:hypothetical protein